MPNVFSPSKYGIQTLFRFAHLKDPKNLIDPAVRKYYIEFPSTGNSVFLNSIQSASTQQEIDDAIANKLSNFQHFTSYKDVEAINPDFYAFANKLDQNKFALKYNEVVNITTGIATLSITEKNTIWDQLFYQSITTRSKSISQALLLLLRADAFLQEFNLFTATMTQNEFSNDELKHFTKTANSIVVIPAKLVVRKKIETTAQTELDVHDKNILLKHIEIDILQSQIMDLEQLKSLLKQAYDAYLLSNMELYEQAYTVYQDQVNNAYSQATLVTDPNTGEMHYDNLQLPEFTAPTYPNFSNDHLTFYITGNMLSTYQEINSIGEKEYDKIIGLIDDKIQACLKNVSSNTYTHKTVIAYNAITFSYNEAVQKDSYILRTKKMPYGFDVYFTNAFTHATNAITIDNVELVISGSNNGFLTNAQLISTGKNHNTYKLFTISSAISGDPGQKDIKLAYRKSGSDTAEVLNFENFDYNATPMNTFPDIYTGYDGIPGNNTVTIFGVNKIGIADYKRVEQEICCYVPGEVSHIENIMAREYKEKSSRQLTRTELTVEESNEREIENLNDTTTTDRFELQSEVSKVVQEDMSTQAAANVSYNNAGFTAGANANFSYGTSGTTSNSNAESYAKDVTERALKRLVEKISTKRTSRMLREFEDINKHGFDNRAGDKHVTGIYRWVDKIYTNNLVNYGKRLIYDFMVAEPSKNFKMWMTQSQVADPNVHVLEKPIHPRYCNWPIRYPSDLNKNNYATIAAYYGAEVDTIPDEYIGIGKSYGDTPGKSGFEFKDRLSGGYDFELEIPEGYQCYRAEYTFGHLYAGQNNNGAKSYLSVGSNIRMYHANSGSSIFGSPIWLNYIEEKLPLSLSTYDVGSFNLNILAYCKRKTEAYQAWQSKTYMQIMNAYSKKCKEYEDDLATYMANQSTTSEKIDYNFNPLLARSIEMRELKRLCIEMITKPFGFNMGKENYTYDAPNFVHNLLLDSDYTEYAIHVKFLEEAFDWNLMAYTLYPYYWAIQKEWKNLIKETSSADHLFQSFLQSGMSLVKVPVTPGYEHRVLYYLDTGKVWIDNGYVLANPNDIYSGINEDLLIKEPGDPGYIEASWETRVPSSLTIIQSDSAPLQADGLPCMCEDGTAIATGNNLMYSASQNENNNFEKITAKYTELNNAFLDALNAYNTSTTPSAICASTLDTIRTLSSVLSALTAQAMLVGYDTAPFIATLTSMQAEISRISALCV